VERRSSVPGKPDELVKLIAECLARYPQMRLEFVLTDRQADLVKEKFDLAFRTGTLKDTSVVAPELAPLRTGR
jgi:DNA-binding transcriptional LysR family regulator